MNTYLKALTCAVLLISSLGHHAPAFPGGAATLDIMEIDAVRSPEWDAIFARADQEHDAARWTARTRTLYSTDLTEEELEALERYTEHRLELWLHQRLGAVPTGRHLRRFDAEIRETNKRYLYLTDESGTRLRDDVGDFRLQGPSSFDIDMRSWDSEVSEAATRVLNEFETQIDAEAVVLLAGIDPEIATRLGARYPELLQSSGERFQQQIAVQAAAARRRFIEARTQDTYSLRAQSEAQTAAAVSASLVQGLDSSMTAGFLQAPELVNTGRLVERAQVISSWEHGFRTAYEHGLDAWQQAENSLLSERVRWEHDSLNNLREAEAAWDNAMAELVQGREVWLAEIEGLLQNTQSNYQQRLNAFTSTYELQRSAAAENQALAHEQLMNEFNSVLDQVHRLEHLRQLSAAELIEAQHQRAELDNGTSTLAEALDQSMAEWEGVLAEIELEQLELIDQIVELEQALLFKDSVPRSAHEELAFLEGELKQRAAAVQRAEAVLEYAQDVSSNRATAAESYNRYVKATEALATGGSGGSDTQSQAEAYRELETARELYEYGVAGYALEEHSPEAVLSQRRAEYERYRTVFAAMSAELEANTAAKREQQRVAPHSGDPTIEALLASLQEASTSLENALVVYNRNAELIARIRTSLEAAGFRRDALVHELRDHTSHLVSGAAPWDAADPPTPFEMLGSVSFARQREGDWFQEYRDGALAEDLGAFSEALSERGDASELLKRFALAYYADTAGMSDAKVVLTVHSDAAVRQLAKAVDVSISSRVSSVTSSARSSVLGDPAVRSLYEHYRVLVYHGVFLLGSREINNDVSGQVIHDLRASADRKRRKLTRQMNDWRNFYRYFDLKSERDRVRARMRAVSPRSASGARADLLSRLTLVAAARSELGALPQPAVVEIEGGLSNDQVAQIMNPAIRAMPAAAQLSDAERDAMLSSVDVEHRVTWNSVLQGLQAHAVSSVGSSLQAEQAARARHTAAYTTARTRFHELLNEPGSDLDVVIAYGTAALQLAPEPLLARSGELWAKVSPAALSASAAALMLVSVEERFLFRSTAEIARYDQAAASQMGELSRDVSRREATLAELVVQGLRHWEETLTRFVAERNDRRGLAERRYYEGLRSFELEARYLEQQRKAWLDEALRLGVESELSGSAERLGLSAQRLRGELSAQMPAGITMQMPDLAQLISSVDTFHGVRVPDLIAAVRDLAGSTALGPGWYRGPVALYLPTGAGYLEGREERTLQRRDAASKILSQVEDAMARSSSIAAARDIEDARKRALRAVVEGNRRVGDGLAELLERYGFRSAGRSFVRRIVADSTVFGGIEHDRQTIRGYREFRAPELRLRLPAAHMLEVPAQEFEIAVSRAREQIHNFLVLIFGGETGAAAALGSGPNTSRDGLLWTHVGAAGKNGSGGRGETGRIMSALISAQMEQQVGIEKSRVAVYNQRLFNTGNDYIQSPSIRELGVVWGQTVGALAGAETGAAVGRLAMQAVFTGADLHRGDLSWQDAGKTMGLELGTIALSAATAGAFQHIDHALAIGAQGGAIGFAASLGLDVSSALISQTGSRALANVDIGDHGISFNRDSFARAMTSDTAVTGYLAGGVGLGVTHGMGAVNAGEQRLFGFRSDQYQSVAGLNNQVGLLAGEALRFAREGELHLNLLNLDTFAAGSSLGLLELRLGDSAQAGLALGTGGMDTSYNRLTTAVAGLDVVNQNRRISAYARQHQQGNGLAEIALRTLFGFGDDAEQRGLYKNLLSGQDHLVIAGVGDGSLDSRDSGGADSIGAESNGTDGQPYRALTRYDEGSDGRVLTVLPVGDDRYAGLALGVTLGHEAYRDGVVTANNSTETLQAAAAHTRMAGRVADDARYGSRYLMSDPDALVDIVMLGAGEDSFAQYVAARYDSSDDYWLIREEVDGAVSLIDDGRGGVYYQGAGGEEHEIGRYRDGDRLEHLSELLSGLGSSVDAAQLGELIAAQGGSYQEGYYLGKGGVLHLDGRSQDMLGARLDYSRMFVTDWRSTGNMDSTVRELAGLIGRNYSFGDTNPSERETNLAFMYREATEFYRDFLDGRAQDHLFYQHQVEDSTGFARNTLCAATIAINAHQLVDPTISMWQIANAVERASGADNGGPVLAANGYVADLHAYTRIIAQEFGSDSYLRAMRDFGSASEAWKAGADAVFVKHVNDLVNPTREHHTLTYRYREDDRFRTRGYTQFDPYATGLSWEQQIAVRYRSMAFTEL